MYVDLHEASFCAVASVLSVEAEKNGYRFEFWSTTPIFAKSRWTATQNGVARGLARHKPYGPVH